MSGVHQRQGKVHADLHARFPLFIQSFTCFAFIVLNNQYGPTNRPQSLQNFMAKEFLAVPMILNPVIYGQL